MTSVVSQSSRSLSRIANEKKPITATDIIMFAYFDQMTQSTNVSNMLISIIYLWISFQVLAMSLWDVNPLDKFAFFSDSETDQMPICISLIVIFVISVFAFTFPIVFYKQRHQFMPWSLIFSRHILELVIPIFLAPLTWVFGNLFSSISDGKIETISLIFLIFVTIITLFFVSLFIFSQQLFGYSAFLSASPLQCSRPAPIISELMMLCIFIFLSAIFEFLPKWAWYILTTIHIFIAIILIASTHDLPFFQFWVNGVYMALNLTTIILDILWMAGVDFFYRSVLILPIFFIMLLISEYIIYRRVKKAKELLEIPVTSDDYTFANYFTDINTDKNIEFYLHVGLKERCPLFINAALIRYTLDRKYPNRVLEHCMKLTVLFPCQRNLLNVLYNNIDRDLKPSYGTKFLLYQVYRIKLLRQSSSSVAATSELVRMKEYTKGLIAKTQNFWMNCDLSLAALGQLQKEVNLGIVEWNQVITDFPNSQMHRDEYVKFLVDVATNYQDACKHRYITGLIEAGKNFAVDYAFRSLIRACPEYIKMRVVDLKGNWIHEKENGTSSESSGKQACSSYTSSSDLDAKLEESIGKTMIKNAKLRLAFQNTLKNRKSNSIQKMTFYSLICGVLCISVFIALFLVFEDYFNFRLASNLLNTAINDYQVKYALTAFYQLLAWANATTPKRFNADMAFTQIEEPKEIIYKPLWGGQEFYKEMGSMSYLSRRRYSEMISRICIMSEEGTDFYILANILLEEVNNFTICVDFKPTEPIQVNLKTLYIFVMQAFSMISTQSNVDSWWSANEYWCDAFVAFNDVDDAIKLLRYSLLLNEKNEGIRATEMIEMIEYILPTCVAIIIIIPMLVLFILSIQETHQLLKMMKNITNDQKVYAAKTIFKTLEDDSDNHVMGMASVTQGSNVSLILLSIFDFMIVAALIVIMVFILENTNSLSDKYKNVNYWTLLSSVRESLVLDAAISTYLGIFITGDQNVTQTLFSVEKLNERVEKQMAQARIFKFLLEEGSDDAISIIGYDEEIEILLNKPWCEPPIKNQSLHDTYACGSITHQMASFDDLIMDTIQKAQYLQSNLNNYLAMNTFHIIVEHLLPQLILLDKYFDNLMVEYNELFDKNFAIFLSVGLVVSILFVLVTLLIIKILTRPYEAALMLLRRVSPIGVCNNSALIDYLLNRHTEKTATEMTTTRSVLYNSSDSIFFLSHTGTIESMNLAVTKTLGYTPEQLLGQHFGVIFNEGDRDKIAQQLLLMISKQSGTSYDDHLYCVTDTELIMPCFTMIFGMTGNNIEKGGDIESFVVILRDETLLVENQEEAERAKKQSEDLLFQILPRDIVVRLNQGEKDISFEIQSASIMFIDIVKFSEYSSSLSPSEIMGTLSSLFGQFDESLAKYPLLTKVKLIGDVYMCAAGLFSTDGPPQTHAEQLVRFGLDALQIVDDTNIRLNINLSIRIGMNSGGPLIAGVLGTDKPVFDIIGDPINIASRLQSTDIPGRIQISQSVYDLINGLDFNIEPRGEIYLKGKGTTNAFLVKPIDVVV